MSVQSDAYEKYYSRELIEAAQNGDKEAMETLVKNNTPLVSSLIKKYSYLSETETYDDLFQIGAIGLIKAIKNFDFSYNTRFSTYAVYIINGELKRHFRDDGIIKVSRNVKSIYIKAKAQSEYYVKIHGTEPGIQTIADAIGESFEDVAFALEACQRPEYLDDFAGSNKDESNRRNEEVIEDKRSSIDDAIDIIALKNAITSLNSEYRQIITLRYLKNMTQNEVAQIVGISQVQVSRLEKKIIEGLRKSML
ncbi:MAG: sigma-70 family RNA polymerase sigma factor [Eubacteriaceae bacterium]|jgi:RNA polymerase sporulation-specific sigma factor|nr:sigma-70 family RNA polymerase sigma factor [Eubacteriaceae bacterium]